MWHPKQRGMEGCPKGVLGKTDEQVKVLVYLINCFSHRRDQIPHKNQANGDRTCFDAQSERVHAYHGRERMAEFMVPWS